MTNTPKHSGDWHAAFRDAIQLTFAHSLSSLSFSFELPLNSQPLRIDALIIKKPPHVLIPNPLAAIFRSYNVVEYKSPRDYLSVPDYHKAGAYIRLYSVLERVEMKDLTLTLVSSRYPKKLLKYLREECGYQVEERAAGIYGVEGDIAGVQVVETGRLGGGGEWLRDLRGGLKGEEIREILERVGSMPEGIPKSAYLYRVIQENLGGFKEVEMAKKKTLDELMEECGAAARWKAQGIERDVKMLRKHGMEPGEIARALELPPDTVSRYLGASQGPLPGRQ